MSCAPGPPTFRLLDHLVGWDPLPDGVYQLTDPDDPGGIQLAPVGQGGPDRSDFLPWLPDPRLAPGCGRCAWYLAAQRRLLRRDRCAGWRPVWPLDCDPGLARRPHAIAARGHLLATATQQAVHLWRREGEQLAALIPGHATALAITPWDEILLARDGAGDLSRFDLAGVPLGRIVTGMSGPVEALATGQPLTPDGDCTIWALTGTAGTWQLWRGTRGSPDPYQQATLDELAAAVSRTSLTIATDQGFCLVEPGPDGDQVSSCFSWDAEPLDSLSAGTAALQTAGQLLTMAIDSGQPRCRWHRVRVDADVPARTNVLVAVATSEDPAPPGTIAGLAPDGFPAGPPNQDDWQDGGLASADFLIDQPPGRYLYVWLRLTGNGTATPVVHRIRLDFPRVTSADQLPAVYTQDPAAADFTERFLSLFDASFEEADRAIERYPALLDPGGVPDEVLPWLGGLLGLAFDPGWDATIRRNLLAAAPSLYRGRGTAAALSQAIKIVFGVDVAISELAADRNWAALGQASQLGSSPPGSSPLGSSPPGSSPPGSSQAGSSPLGSTRLFSRSRTRFLVGSSALSSAPIRSFGNPDDDPLTAQANRIQVLVPPASGGSGPDLAALRQLVVSQAPAHTVAEVRPGGLGLVVGIWSAVGVDTALAPLPAPVLQASTTPGAGQPVTLGRCSVLWPSARGSWAGVRLGAGLAVGMNTMAQ
jgi:phage tail-like protein